MVVLGRKRMRGHCCCRLLTCHLVLVLLNLAENKLCHSFAKQGKKGARKVGERKKDIYTYMT